MLEKLSEVNMYRQTTLDPIVINEECELSQDSFYTRNPEDYKIKGAIGPNSPEKIFVESIILTKHEDEDDVWYSAIVRHNSIWEIYTDTAVGPFVALKLEENGYKGFDADFSEQGMQDNGSAHLDVFKSEAA